jgi:hypothetical protein
MSQICHDRINLNEVSTCSYYIKYLDNPNLDLRFAARLALAHLESREATQELGDHHSSNRTANPTRGSNESCL